MAASFGAFTKFLGIVISTSQEVNVKIIFLPVFSTWYPSDRGLAVLGCWGTGWDSVSTHQKGGYKGHSQSWRFKNHFRGWRDHSVVKSTP